MTAKARRIRRSKNPSQRTWLRRMAAFRYIKSYKSRHDGTSPTLREIAAYVGTSSTSTINYDLDWLKKEGLVRFGHNKPRSIEVVGGQWIAPPL